MCGIVGIFDTRGRRDVGRGLLSRMNESQHHRGPDEGAMHFEPGLGFGHRRLSIIDLSTGQQPMFNEDGSVVIIYNGEIYNYQQLILELVALGHRFRTRSDTEVIIHAWEAWGAACVERFRGMFAFALWDRKMKTLVLARDRLGIKPLYYAATPQRVLFASQLKAFRAVPRWKPTIDEDAVVGYLRHAYIAQPRTIYHEVAKLAPGHILTLQQGSRSPPKCFWDLRTVALAGVRRRFSADAR